MSSSDLQALSGLVAIRELRECVGCGAKFLGPSWHTHCHACYRAAKPDTEGSRRDADAEVRLLKMELERTRDELRQEREAIRREREAKTTITERLAALESRYADLQGERDLWMKRYETALTMLPSKHPVIPPAILRRLLWLCHPDRHGNSEAATVATAWLLAQRGN